MSDPRHQYIDYVQNVLGVKNLVLEPEQTGELSAVVQVKPLIVRIENLSTYTAEENDLLSKMLAALKLDVSQYDVVELHRDAHGPAQLYLDMFDANPQPASGSINSQSVTTFSARTLLRQPQLKKIAWVELQKVISFFTAN